MPTITTPSAGRQRALDLLTMNSKSLEQKAQKLRSLDSPNFPVSRELATVLESTRLLDSEAMLSPVAREHLTRAAQWLTLADTTTSATSTFGKMQHGEAVFNAQEQVMLARRDIDPTSW